MDNILQLYHTLLKSIKEPTPVTDYCAGAGICYTTLDTVTGFSSCWNEWRFPPDNLLSQQPTIQDLASLILSWNYTEASLGLSALNAYYHQSDLKLSFEQTKQYLYSFLAGKRMLLCGHFPLLEPSLQECGPLHFLAQHTTMEEDYPLSAASYIMKDYDVLILTELSFIDKSLPKLLSIAQREQKPVLLVGKSAPLAPFLLANGISMILSFQPKKEQIQKRIVETRCGFSSLPMISYADSLHSSKSMEADSNQFECYLLGSL